MEASEKLFLILQRAINESTLKKIVLSKPKDKETLKAICRPILIKGQSYIQTETFSTDGKARHQNIEADAAPQELVAKLSLYSQMNIITTGGDAEARVSKKGKLTVIGNPQGGTVSAPNAHDRDKNNILKEGNLYDFLIELGVTDGRGRVFDKKRPKFRQIDRFLHYINDIYDKLPKSGRIYVLDLCCGKSYLTFAAYWFLTEVKKRDVIMIGADLKKDVIEFCSATAEKLGYSSLTFICRDITEYTPDFKPNLVLSLHACDIATDIVLTTAARLQADVILSTPCCHHQMNSELNTASTLGELLSPVLEHSLLKQKLAVALTDALRCKRLQASGYAVDVTELIDPENTPKNLMIRAVRVNMKQSERDYRLAEFEMLSKLCGVDIFDGSKAVKSFYSEEY